jgi:NTP pyrophosphatase (non-canonical NTP hydrolase)
MINENLRSKILEFRKSRDWEQFHTPRNLATAISIEASELLEPFRWSSTNEEFEIATAKKIEISHEIADIAILLTLLANDLSIDISTAVEEKLKLNAEKYPIEKSYGSKKKYTEL